MISAPIDVTAGVLATAGRVLICQRAAGGYHPGQWEFPGGKVEAGESLEAALHRELQEELGIAAHVGPAVWITAHQYPGRGPFRLTFFSIRRYRGIITNRIFAAIRWEAVDALGSVDFLAGDRDFVNQLMHGAIRLPDTEQE